MTTALEEGEGLASRPGCSLPPGMIRYTLYRRLGGPQGRYGQVRKISPPPGFDPRTVQLVASRYTDYANRHFFEYEGTDKMKTQLLLWDFMLSLRWLTTLIYSGIWRRIRLYVGTHVSNERTSCIFTVWEKSLLYWRMRQLFTPKRRYGPRESDKTAIYLILLL